MIKIMSSNIRFQNSKDANNDWPHRKKILVDIINKYDPDILCTQEGRRPQLLDLNSLLSQNIVDGHRAFISERMYPTIYKTNLINKIASNDIWLSKTPYQAGSLNFNSSFPRLATFLKFSHAGKEFFLVNTHLDHVLDETRNDQIQVLVKEIKKYIRNEYLVFCGDFNSNPKSFVYSYLLNSFDLYDPWYNFYFTEETTHHPFTGYNPSGSRIDWILLDKRLKADKFELVKDNQFGKYPSDHFPIFCEFSL